MPKVTIPAKIKIICDRCGKDCNDRNFTFIRLDADNSESSEIGLGELKLSESYMNGLSPYLCKDCIRSYVRWLRAGKTELSDEGEMSSTETKVETTEVTEPGAIGASVLNNGSDKTAEKKTEDEAKPERGGPTPRA